MLGEAATLVLQFGEEFGSDEARKAVDRLEEAETVGAVELDFTRCRHVDVGAMTLVALAASRLGGSVRARGLTRHDHRILEYLGVRLPGAARPDPRG